MFVSGGMRILAILTSLIAIFMFVPVPVSDTSRIILIFCTSALHIYSN